jgi:hypothetical protein
MVADGAEPDDGGDATRFEREVAECNLALIGCALDAAVDRGAVVQAMLAELCRLSAHTADDAFDQWASLFEDIEAATTELLARQACYQAAVAAIAAPIPASLLAFLG